MAWHFIYVQEKIIKKWQERSTTKAAKEAPSPETAEQTYILDYWAVKQLGIPIYFITSLYVSWIWERARTFTI